jgi:nucleotide-binding universal stress UspA family protein
MTMKLMVCTDGTKPSDRALEVAAQYADITGSQLTVINVIESDVSREESAYDEYGKKQDQAKSIIKGASDVVSKFAPGLELTTRIAVGPVSSEIVRIAEDEGFNAIFMGATGSNRIKRMLLGGVTDDVMHYAHCPVTVVR